MTSSDDRTSGVLALGARRKKLERMGIIKLNDCLAHQLDIVKGCPRPEGKYPLSPKVCSDLAISSLSLGRLVPPSIPQTELYSQVLMGCTTNVPFGTM